MPDRRIVRGDSRLGTVYRDFNRYGPWGSRGMHMVGQSEMSGFATTEILQGHLATTILLKVDMCRNEVDLDFGKSHLSHIVHRHGHGALLPGFNTGGEGQPDVSFSESKLLHLRRGMRVPERAQGRHQGYASTSPPQPLWPATRYGKVAMPLPPLGDQCPNNTILASLHLDLVQHDQIVNAIPHRLP